MPAGGNSDAPQTTSVNPNSPQLQGLQGDFSEFLQNLLTNGGATDPSSLTTAGQGTLEGLLGNNPEGDALASLAPGLLEIFGRNSAQATGEAAFPLFQRALQEGQAGLSNSALGRFSTAREGQGVDLTQRALQDFNLLQQQAFMQGTSNQLGAGQLLGQLAGVAGQGQFGRAAQATQIGLQGDQMNPALQLLLGGLTFGRPAPNDTIVTDNAPGLGDRFGGAASGALSGAAAGSVIPGLGTGIGAVLGGLGGLFGGGR